MTEAFEVLRWGYSTRAWREACERSLAASLSRRKDERGSRVLYGLCLLLVGAGVTLGAYLLLLALVIVVQDASVFR